jgi:radical SAM superfamily enzyme YgiQ (UPF0313 family)
MISWHHVLTWHQEHQMHVLLVNTNRLQPPITPVGLDYLAAALEAAGHDVSLLDLCFEGDPLAAVDACLARTEVDVVGVSVRNIDDCLYPGESYLEDLSPLVERLRSLTDATVVLGGVPASVMPEAMLGLTGADLAVTGEGELALVRLAAGEQDVPGLVRKTASGFHRVPAEPMDLAGLPVMSRAFVDNSRYYREGGHVGFETKRGCASNCTYCVEPGAKGRRVRVRPPEAVAAELQALSHRGIHHLQTCDSEFNRPLEHALAICEAIAARGLDRHLRWYAYCIPTPLPDELVAAMQRAGCVGVLIGVDSGDEEMLRRLGRDFTVADIQAAVAACRRHGITAYCTLLLAGPGETEQTVRQSIGLMKQVEPDLVGLALGVRVYPNTALAREVSGETASLYGPGASTPDLIKPTFYFSPALGEDLFPLVRELTQGDPRFLFMDPARLEAKASYVRLVTQGLQSGSRGAHWDIVRRAVLGLPPA